MMGWMAPLRHRRAPKRNLPWHHWRLQGCRTGDWPPKTKSRHNHRKQARSDLERVREPGFG